MGRVRMIDLAVYNVIGGERPLEPLTCRGRPNRPPVPTAENKHGLHTRRLVANIITSPQRADSSDSTRVPRTYDRDRAHHFSRMTKSPTSSYWGNQTK